MELFYRRRRAHEARIAGQLFAVRLTLDALIAAVGAESPIAPALAKVQARGVEVLDEVGMPEGGITCFEEWMGGFIAAAKRRG